MSRAACRPLVLLAALAALLAGCGDDPAPDDATGQRVPAEGTTGAVTVTASSVVIGDPDAPERVHVYQDLNCPHCKALHEETAADLAAWAQGGDVAVEFTVVDYLGPRTAHGFSTRGANLLALVADVDPEAWPAVQQALLDLQPSSTTAEVTDEDLLAAAQEAGADLGEDAAAALEGLAYSGWVEAATAQAAADGISYIPQVWVDGELVEGASHAETAALLRAAVSD
ncbi:thioredoxin domain-containing protein [Georgenia phoenicis]|uniref:thioredoxin domain-containing protein n=1 Tax=unclassified Georgenia TaxID=2626815 RepID=UPI0039AF9CFE